MTQRFPSVSFLLSFILFLGLALVPWHAPLQETKFDHWDEYLTAERSLEMAQTESWFVARYNGSVILNKPALQYAWSAALIRSGVDSSLATRVPNLVFFLLFGVALGLWLRTGGISSPPIHWTFLLCFGLLLAVPISRYYATSGFLDLGQAAFLLLILSLARGAQGNPRLWLWAGLAGGLAVWQKTPLPLLGFALPAGLSLAFGDWRTERQWFFILAGSGIAAGFWLVLTLVQAGAAGVSFADFLVKGVQKVSGERMDAALLLNSEKIRQCLWALGWLLPSTLFAGIPVVRSGWRERDAAGLSLVFLAGAAFCILLATTTFHHRYVLPVALLWLVLNLEMVVTGLREGSRRIRRQAWIVVALSSSGLLFANAHPDFRGFRNFNTGALHNLHDFVPSFCENINRNVPFIHLSSHDEERWLLNHAGVLLYACDRLPEQQPIWWVRTRPDGSLTFPLPVECLGVSRVFDFMVLREAYPEVYPIEFYRGFVLWGRGDYYRAGAQDL